MAISKVLSALSQQDAAAKGLKMFFTGQPCDRSHTAERYTSDGTCSVCVRRAKQKIWRDANKAHLQVKNREWNQANAESQKAVRRAAYLRDKEKIAEYHRSRRAENTEAKRLWRTANPEKPRLYMHTRRARLRQVDGTLSEGLSQRLFQEQGGRCACPCRAPLAAEWHMDHIVPLARGGLNVDSNIQLLTAQCNYIKSTRDNEEFMAAQLKRYPKVPT